MIFFLAWSGLCSKVIPTCVDATCDRQIRDRSKYVIGDRIAITAKFTGFQENNDTEIVRYERFYPKVDQFSMLEIQDFDCFLTNLTNSTLQLFVRNYSTGIWAYRPASNPNIITQFFSATIQFSEGMVTNIGFDTSFDENTCKKERLTHRCAEVRNLTASCHGNEVIKVFQAFIGTDSKKTPMSTIQYLPSTFLRFGLRGVMDDTVNMFNKAKDWIIDLFK